MHFRQDDGKLFYIGKGKSSRPFSKKRNIIWKRIVNKHGYYVKIIQNKLSEQCAFNLEKSLISKYRTEGVFLANLTDGGDGSSGYKHTSETKKKIGESSRNMVRTAESSIKLSNSRKRLNITMSRDLKLKIAKSKKCKPFVSISPLGIKLKWDLQTECADELKLNVSHLNGCLKGSRERHKGYTFKYMEQL